MLEFIKNKTIRDWIPILLILLLATFLRLIFLAQNPAAINGDELYYVLADRAVALSGHDFSGTWHLFEALLFKFPPGVPQAELPYFLLYPAISIFNLSLFTTKFTYAIISVATVYVFYLLGRELFDRRAGLIIAALAAINPWSIFIGRTVYEMVPSTFFYLLAVYFVLKGKGSRILISLPFFLLAFYAYIATKTIIIPTALVVTIYAFFANKRKYFREYLIVNIFCIILVALFFLFFKSSMSGVRTDRIFTPLSPEMSSEVDYLRKLSISPAFVSSSFDNKLSLYANDVVVKVFKILSFNYLFLSSDDYVGIYRHGLFYYVDAVFLVMGFMYLFAKRRKLLLFLSVMILVGALPQVLYRANTDIFTPHLAIFIAFLIFPIGYGIAQTFEDNKKWVQVVIFAVYIISLANFANIYFFQFPLRGHFDFTSREISNYVKLAAVDNSKIYAYVSNPQDEFNKYLYYTNGLTKQNFINVANSFNSEKYQVGNVSFFPCGDIVKNKDKKALTIYQSGLCDPHLMSAQTGLKVARLDDGGELFRIYNDRLCSSYTLKGYPSGLSLSDFSVESLSTQKFCETFITR